MNMNFKKTVLMVPMLAMMASTDCPLCAAGVSASLILQSYMDREISACNIHS